MNKRDFLKTLAKAAAGFTILPSAVTYARKWRRVDGIWVVQPYQMELLYAMGSPWTKNLDEIFYLGPEGIKPIKKFGDITGIEKIPISFGFNAFSWPERA